MEYGFSTIDRVNSLIEEGIRSVSVISRHSARNYDRTRPHMEPFMGLTEDGKRYAKEYAERLNFDGTVSFYSSMICRCLETAFMMEKGIKNCEINSNILEESLFPFYVINPKKVYEVVSEKSEDEFFRMWFEGELSERTIEDAKESAVRMGRFMERCLKENTVNLMISHDWNLYIVQEYLLGRSYFEEKSVEFLDGLILYRSSSKLFIENDRGVRREIGEKDL